MLRIRRLFMVVLGLTILAVCGITAAYFIDQLSMKPPLSQIVSPTNNICLDFVGNLGSQESLLMLTHYCDVPLKRNLRGDYDESMYIDMQETMECPKIEIADKDNDGLVEVYLVQGWLCKQFAHPWGNDSRLLTFRIDVDGKFHEVAKE